MIASLETLLICFFKELLHHDITFCVLRNYQTLPAQTANDVDILVSPVKFKKAVQLLQVCAKHNGFRMHMQVEHACLLMMFHSRNNHHIQCHIDLYAHITWKGFLLADSQRILASRQPFKNFFVPAPEWEQAVNLLVRLVYQGRIKDKYKKNIIAEAKYRDRFLNILKSIIGDRESLRILKYIIRADWKSIEKRVSFIRAAIVVRGFRYSPLETMKHQVSQVGRFVRRLYAPAGFALAFLGPDGAGKSSLIKELNQKLRPSFQGKQLVIHWRPELIISQTPSINTAVSDPHGQASRGKILSVFFLAYHTLMFILGWWIKVAPIRFKGGIILLDRYYHDILVDRKRYRMSMGKPFVILGAALVPKPDQIIILDAHPDVLRSRKKEVIREETIRQCMAFKALAKVLPNATQVNADMPLSEVADEAFGIIMANLSKRCEGKIE